jgi:predicted aldo/keto reductase-like oxidoreductase
MKYRPLGRTGLQLSEVSLGTEYLINRPRRHVVGVIREAVERGINYFDLFFAQPAFRDNMGAAFAGLRKKVFLAAHLGAVEKDGQYTKSRDLGLSERFFEDFLARYRTRYVDVLFLHNCDSPADFSAVMRPQGLLGLAKRLRKEGRARLIGFSTHTVSTALKAVRTGDVDVIMFPVNAAGNAVPGRKKLFAACASHGVGLVAMKPYAGGKLLANTRTLELERWHVGVDSMKLTAAGRRRAKITPAQCLSYVLAQPGVSTVVPGCKDKRELAAALAYLDAPPAGRDFSSLVARYRTHVEGECVYCNHCLPCPSNIDIGATMRALDAAKGLPSGRARTAKSRRPGVNPKTCIECGACVSRCPFGVEVIAAMRKAAKLIG